MAGCRRLMIILGVTLLFSTLSVSQIIGNSTPEGELEGEKNETAIVLTGNPQIDYIHDPNLPAVLGDYDLSDYPFYSRVPNVKFNFSCDDRHDGFYASIPHKCQVYHNCLFGVRYDFLCANYTAFDQSQFICQYANIVDCKNSEKFFVRNEELYVEETTTTTTPRPPQIQIVYVDRPQPNRRKQGKPGGNRRKRPTTASPLDYYEYYDEPVASQKKNQQAAPADEFDYIYDEQPQIATTSTTTTTTARTRHINRRPETSSNKRITQRIQAAEKPLSNNDFIERDQEQPQNVRKSQNRKPQRRRRKKVTTTTTPAPEYEYYDYYYEDDVVQTTKAPVVQQSTINRPRPSQGRPSARDRQAQLQSRKKQLQNSRSQPERVASAPAPVVDTNLEETYYYDDLPPLADVVAPDVADAQPSAANFERTFIEAPEREASPSRSQIRRRPQQFRGSRREEANNN